MRHKFWIISALLTVVLLLLLAPFAGVASIDPLRLLHGQVSAEDHTIFWSLRVPRTITALLVGGGLALGGVVFQSLFRNPLATPYSLSVASGATLGAGIALTAGLSGAGFMGLSLPGAGAVLGAVLTVLLMLSPSSRSGFGSGTLILVGIMLSFFFSSLLLFVQYISEPGELFRLNRWLLGSVAVRGYEQLPMLVVTVGTLLLVILRYSRELDLLGFGDEYAASRGVAVVKSRLILLASSAFAVAVIAATCGLIGFVDIVVPLALRLVIGQGSRVLAVCSFLGAGSLLVFCDSLGRVAAAPMEIPVGVTAAVIGAPLCIAMIILNSRNSSSASF